MEEGASYREDLAPPLLEHAGCCCRVFINPSTSDVVATTSAEALAMGKWLLCAEHPSNKFFRDFQNALIYTSSADFSEKLKFAEVRPACHFVLSTHPGMGVKRGNFAAPEQVLYKMDRPHVQVNSPSPLSAEDRRRLTWCVSPQAFLGLPSRQPSGLSVQNTCAAVSVHPGGHLRVVLHFLKLAGVQCELERRR